jgi:predicted DNA-binding transcriptional regulator YafY
MFDSQPNIKRKYEILARCLDKHNVQRIEMEDLAAEYGVDAITIKRDLQSLRLIGVDIHSTAKHGVVVNEKLGNNLVRNLLLYYVGMCYSANVFDIATLLLVEHWQEQALSQIVILQRCIDCHNLVCVEYPSADSAADERVLEPLLIFHSDKSWRLLAREDGNVKQFHLEKMTNIRPTVKPFTPIPVEEIESYFSHSWKSWIGKERYHVKMLLSHKWHSRFQERTLTVGVQKTPQDDGSVLYEFDVNSLNEIAGWIASRGKGVIVIEPKALKDMVLELAKQTLKNYA